MLVNLYVSEHEDSRGDFLFQKTVTFSHVPMVGDVIAPEAIDGLEGGPFVITARQHAPYGELDIFAVKD